MKKSTITILIVSIISIIVILGYSTYKSLEDAVGRKTNGYEDLRNYTNDSNNSSNSIKTISDSLKEELLLNVPLYSEKDAYQIKNANTTNVKEAMFYMAYKYIKANNLYNTQNRSLRNICADKYGNQSRCIMFISNEYLDEFLLKRYNKTLKDIYITSITFKDTSEVVEKLNDDFYVVLTNEIKEAVKKITISSKSYSYDNNIIIDETCLFTKEDKNGYHGVYKTSKLDQDSLIDDVSFNSVDEVIKKYSSKAGKFEHTFVKVDANYVWTKTVLK